MSTIPTLDDQEIEARVGAASFQRARPYFRNGAIFDARRQGMSLQARCEGSQAASYRLHLTFDDTRIVEAACSCPVGGGGYCKHTAALLLTWKDRPEEFAEVEDVAVALERRSKEELIALVKQMLRQQPELELLLETPLPVPGGRRIPVDPRSYRRQAEMIFRHGGHEWGVETAIGDELEAITAIGDDFAGQGDFASAAIVYEAVSAVVVDHFSEFSDENGDLGDVVRHCVTGLGSSLVGLASDTEALEPVLQALFAVYRFDTKYGGIGLADEVPELVMAYATVEQRQTVAAWVREALPAGSEWSDGWRRQIYGAFLLELEADTLDDEAFLRLCRETSRTEDLVDRLLALERVDEAADEARRATDYELLQLAATFLRHGRGDLAETLLVERSATSDDTRILHWLKGRYADRHDTSAALALAERLFHVRPSLEEYQEVRRLAQEAGRWQALRGDLIASLAGGLSTHVLLQVYLDEGKIDQALNLVQSPPRAGYGFGFGAEMRLHVAAAAEETRPRASLEIYQDVAGRLITARGRENYREACGVLSKTRALFEHLGEGDAWTSYITRLRDENRSLRALKEELAAAGL